jgi:hypothetical protein
VRKRLAIAAAALAVVAGGVLLAREAPEPRGYPSVGQLSFSGTFDPGCQLVGGEGGWSHSYFNDDKPGVGFIEREIVGQGKCAAKFVATGTDSSRAELGTRTWPTGAVLLFEFLTYVPAEAPYVGYIAQLKQNNNPCANGGVSISNYNNPAQVELVTRSDCDEDNDRWKLGVPPRDQWFATKVKIKIANDGFAKVLIDPDAKGPEGYEVRLPLTQMDTLSGTQVKPRLGLYGDPPTGTVVFHDGYRLRCLQGCG